ncbi:MULTISPECIES: hypothetical protein [unclassified Undibacterium]|uniref:hypothetical protein n=1 Tax=unclassified Undibacterium TaxID=2630295 RepID=UPI002AC8B04A|nr:MULTISPECIES: hypothetical protein [unclassified Undibacterium]MEB0137723.1 hypothetical protein [Undibacterium sp. CCC2.1]MEB0172835.1 hypothetical protein [Undibacterium sp. CCC1.1]MEB0176691.1 hypothetical protein [Undibacterium sp. CCC3.4]MEB0215983.1 hypothetical protein [Undibacterium sp. 5I2]WPX42298.1 hypothetical protein RHM61_12935 [Undibacterium sp. CCC3.4]
MRHTRAVTARRQHHLASPLSACLMRLVVGGRRSVMAIITALAFVLLSATAATHHHADRIEDQACSICTAVANQADLATPPASLALCLIILLYLLLPATPVLRDFAAPRLLPPGCGPPTRH